MPLPLRGPLVVMMQSTKIGRLDYLPRSGGCADRGLRQVHRAGDKLFIGHSGDTVGIIDGATGEICRAASL